MIASFASGRAARALALCVLVAAGAGCAPDQRSSPVGTSGELPDQEVTDFVLTETDAGRPQWTNP